MPASTATLPDALGLSASWALPLLAVPLFFLGWAIFRDVRAHRQLTRAARASAREAAEAASRVLAAGDTVVLGTVELAKDEEVAARVEIDQEGGENLNSGMYYFTWTEVGRRVTMRPFYLRHASGQRVRVEPSAQALLVDALDGLILVDETHRTRIAQLTPGERVFASGTLARRPDPESMRQDYPGQVGTGWVLTPPSTEPLLLSSENLDLRFERQARGPLWRAVAMSVTMLGMLLISGGFLESLAMGADIQATVVEPRSERHTDSDGDSHVEYTVLVRVDSLEKSVVVDSSSRWNAAVEQGMTVPLRFVSTHPGRSALGHGAHLSMWALFALISLLATGGTLMAVLRSRSRRWFEAKLEEVGPGKLAENGRSVKTS